MSLLPTRHSDAADADPRLDALLRHAIVIGVVLVLLSPAARGMHATIGWLPLWLLAMPLTAWWALHRFALPPVAVVRRPAAARRPRVAAQARRRPQRHREALPRAA